MADLRWSHRWENDLTVADHHRLSFLLQLVFPWTSGFFTDGRSWAGTRPEFRVTAHHAGEVIGHGALLRRFLRVDGVDQLVGEVGLLAVHPDWADGDLGRELARQVVAALAGLKVPFGYFNGSPDAAAFFPSVGWVALPASTMIRMPTVNSPLEASLVAATAMVLPVAAGIGQWPRGRVIDRHGFET